MRIIVSTVTAVAIILSVGLTPGCAPKETSKNSGQISRPFVYSGYTHPAYKCYNKASRYVPMRDGTRLAADIFLPAKGPERKSFPVIFQMLPYTRAFAYPKMPLPMRMGIKMISGASEPSIDAYVMKKEVRLFLSHRHGRQFR